MLKSVFISFMLFSLALQQPAGQPTDTSAQKIAEISFARSKHDFGTLLFKDSPRSTRFQFTNTGDAPLVIVHAETTCRCLSVSYPKKPILPGEQGNITVTYSPKNELGKFSNEIRIYTNGAVRRHILVVEGEVIKQQ